MAHRSILLSVVLLVGCGDDSMPMSDTGLSDSGGDSGRLDAALDAASDVAVDTGNDASIDVRLDSTADVALDVPPDVNADAPVDTGRTLGEGECRDGADCTMRLGDRCLLPGAFIGCGICRIPLMTCGDDDECTAGEICDSRPEDCFCGSERTCRADCTEAGCGAGQECDTSGRCEAASCDDAVECPTNFDCNTNACERRSCSDDAECVDGWCVGGACYDTPGTCTPIPA